MFLPALMTSGGMSSLPSALTQARPLIALRSSSTEGGPSKSSVTGRRMILSTVASVTIFSLE